MRMQALSRHETTRNQQNEHNIHYSIVLYKQEEFKTFSTAATVIMRSASAATGPCI